MNHLIKEMTIRTTGKPERDSEYTRSAGAGEGSTMNTQPRFLDLTDRSASPEQVNYQMVSPGTYRSRATGIVVLRSL